MNNRVEVGMSGEEATEKIVSLTSAHAMFDA